MDHDPNGTLRCSECKRKPRENENADDELRAESDGVGELVVFCPECWGREFGSPPGPADEVHALLSAGKRRDV